jgi:hypothetical protein
VKTKATRNKKVNSPLVHSGDFVANFEPPVYLIDGMLQRGYLYSVTGHPGDGKTAIALTLASHVARGKAIGDYRCRKGVVIYFAGENDKDIQAKWVLMAHKLGFDPDEMDLYFYPSTDIDLENGFEKFAQSLAGLGIKEVALVVFDTNTAYFTGDNENDNVQARHQMQVLRQFASLPGDPTVLALCHPSKSATDLIPRGGYAALGEVDGNITVTRESGILRFAPYLPKFRGMLFDAVQFKLLIDTCDALKYDGGSVRTAYSLALDSIEGEQALKKNKDEEQRVGELLKEGRSYREIAIELGWKYSTGKPDQSKVQRAVTRLELAKNKRYSKH